MKAAKGQKEVSTKIRWILELIRKNKQANLNFFPRWNKKNQT